MRELTVAALDARMADFDAERARLLRIEVDLRADFQRRAAAIRGARPKPPAPGERADQNRQHAEREQIAAEEVNIRADEDQVRVQIDDLRSQADRLGVVRERLTRERAALAKLDAWDELCAATGAANAALAALNSCAAASPERADAQRDADAALHRRRAAWLAWRLDHGGDAMPPTFTAPRGTR